MGLKKEKNNLTTMPKEDETDQITVQEVPNAVLRQQIHLQEFQGPLPHPDILQGFNKVVNDGAERVFQEFEKNGKHTRELEKAALEAERRTNTRGQWMSFVIMLISLFVIIGSAYLGVYIASIITSVITMFILAKTLFLPNKKPN